MVKDALEEDMERYHENSLPFSGISYVYVMVTILNHWNCSRKN